VPKDNVVGATEDNAPELKLTPSVDAGYYLLIKPLSLGEHTLQLTGATNNCGDNNFTQNVTYHLTVVRHSDDR
jgi:hypothetical protein